MFNQQLLILFIQYIEGGECDMEKNPVRYYIVKDKEYRSPECFRNQEFMEIIKSAAKGGPVLTVKGIVRYE